MAPTKDSQSVDADDKTLMLKEALKCVNGNLDFEKLAIKMGVANGEAMRKRFKRFFEKDDEPIQLKGSILGNSEDGAVPKTPRTPKPKATKSISGDDAKAAHTTGKKRSSAEAESGEDENEPEEAADTTTETPAKKPRTAVKAPRTPRTPKSPGFPKESRTPKSTANTKASKNGPATASVNETGDGLDGSEDAREAEVKKSRIGSPELQAKADAAIKKAEQANGAAMGEPAKQAKRDAIEMKVNADDET